MYLAGLHVPDDDVRELIKAVDEPTRSLLEKSLAFEAGVVVMTIEDREYILWALDAKLERTPVARRRVPGPHHLSCCIGWRGDKPPAPSTAQVLACRFRYGRLTHR